MSSIRQKESKNLKKIQSRLKRQGISVTYDDVRDEIVINFPEIKLAEMSLTEVDKVYDSMIGKLKPVNLVAKDGVREPKKGMTQPTALVMSRSEEIEQTETLPSSINELAPEEAISLIQEIAAEETTENQALIRSLLEQVDQRTTTIADFFAALPHIEEQLLTKKLQAIERKRVDYNRVFQSYFQGGEKLTADIEGLISEYGVSI